MGSVNVPDPPCGTDACRRLLHELGSAAERRDVIGMAKGLLIARGSEDADHAFSVLRRASQRENVKVYEIAARIVRSAIEGAADSRTLANA